MPIGSDIAGRDLKRAIKPKPEITKQYYQKYWIQVITYNKTGAVLRDHRNSSTLWQTTMKKNALANKMAESLAKGTNFLDLWIKEGKVWKL